MSNIKEVSNLVEVKTPNEVFSYGIDCIKESKFSFNMDQYYRTTRRTHDTVFDSRTPSCVRNPCGTSACIAGDMAYSIDPSRKDTAPRVVYLWVMNGSRYADSDQWGGIWYSLESVFHEPALYGVSELEDITKDRAVRLLRELSQLSDWDLVHHYIQYKIDSHYGESNTIKLNERTEEIVSNFCYLEHD